MALRKSLFSALGLAVGLLCCSLSAQAQNTIVKNTTVGAPPIKSIQAICFASGGTLLIGDGMGAQVIAIDTGDTQSKSWAKTEKANILEELAGRLGTKANNIQITKVAVNPASQTAYIAVRNLSAKKDLILTVDGDGKISEFSLEKVKYLAIPLPEGEKAPVTLITDISFGGDRILVAAQANETFKSKMISIPVPLDTTTKATIYSTNTYHVAHGGWETNAPIRTILPYEEQGKKYVVGTFTCTPIVKYPVEDIKPNTKVDGTSVIELGNGNTPQDMFTYQKNGKTYILLSSSRGDKFHQSNPVGPSKYWTAKVDINILKETNKINKDAIWRVGKGDKAATSKTDMASVVPEYHGVVHMDKLNDQQALVIRTSDKTGLDLVVLPLP